MSLPEPSSLHGLRMGRVGWDLRTIDVYVFSFAVSFGLCLTTLTSTQASALSSVPPIAAGVMVKPPQWSVKLLPTVNVASLKLDSRVFNVRVFDTPANGT